MKILMMTNTYAPMVGGIEESIRSFTRAFEKSGHQVIIVAPECEGVPPDEVNVIRLRAIQKFNHSEFSIALPMSHLLPELMKTFMPDIVHCHHPFWMGDIALRLSSQFGIPLVFTYHTMFEQHMHYLPVQNEGIKRFIIELFTGYANLADQVIVPSESVRGILLARGVGTPIEVIPTGVDLQRFSRGNGNAIRKRLGIPSDAVVIGYVGRLALEKNLEFLSRSVADYLKTETKTHFLICGDGPLKDAVKEIFDGQGIGKQLHFSGVLKGQELVNGYHAMNVFAFSSVSETQGIVLVEAMAAGVPVVAIDAPGVREVVKDGYNGRLIFQDNRDSFIEALKWCLNHPPGELRRMKRNARASAAEFEIGLCAQKMLLAYQKVRVKEYVSPDREGSVWYSLADRIRNEWHMFKNMMQAGGAAITETTSADKPVLNKARRLLRNLPRLLSLSEWSATLLRLPREEQAETEPGLVLIQIDGLSGFQLKEAFAHKKMPFLKGLLQKEFYRMYHHYPGLPSSTPSVQGELFYGIKQIVPGFSFFDRESGKVFRMYDSASAIEIEQRLAGSGQGLLEQGSSYSNIFSGGARESHFCATSLGWGKIWKDIHPVNFLVFVVTHLPSAVRICALTVWEIVLGIVDFLRGISKGENFKKEFEFIYLRALICVLLRELVTLGVKIDIARGLPVIHLNLLGYDELAHNHGPSSSSSHWSLQGIDRAIEKIYHKALHSARRSYDIWVYSDHGEEDAVSYTMKYGRSVQGAVREVFKKFDAYAGFLPSDNESEQLQRARFLGISSIEHKFSNAGTAQNNHLQPKLIVTAMGPTGNIYLPRKMSKDEMRRFARELVDAAKIPVLMFPEEQGQVRVLTNAGEYTLPHDAGKVLGEGHPCLKQVTEDLIRLCHHPKAGDLTFMGCKPGEKYMTFPLEHGAHSGPGREETNGFALLPVDIIPRQREKTYITPTDLRFAALRFLKRPMPPQESKPYVTGPIPEKAGVVPEVIRIMSYNVHSCIGMDGKVSPERIARVIRRHDPDIVALQELDAGRKRTWRVDQPLLIARELAMRYYFYPSLVAGDERYGNAVLSRYPMELVRAGRLPGIIRNRVIEPRGAIWAAIDIAGTKINLFNTHLGFFPREGIRQARALLGPEWLAHPVCRGPVVLCGDFNALPNSSVYRAIRGILHDVQEELDNHRPKATWFSHYPIGRIDHIFVGPGLKVTHVDVSRTDLDKLVSDHLPLIADMKLKNPVLAA